MSHDDLPVRGAVGEIISNPIVDPLDICVRQRLFAGKNPGIEHKNVAIGIVKGIKLLRKTVRPVGRQSKFL